MSATPDHYVTVPRSHLGARWVPALRVPTEVEVESGWPPDEGVPVVELRTPTGRPLASIGANDIDLTVDGDAMTAIEVLAAQLGGLPDQDS